MAIIQLVNILTPAAASLLARGLVPEPASVVSCVSCPEGGDCVIVFEDKLGMC